MPYTPQWVGTKPNLGMVNLTDVTVSATGLGAPGQGVAILPSVPMANQLGETISGWDPLLGFGEFVYLKGVASIAIGDVVTYNGWTGVTTRWAGTALTGFPLAVAISQPSATQWGWFQIAGNAIVNVGGTVAAGDLAYWNATATVKTAAVASKQVLNIVASLANGGTLQTLPVAVSLVSTQAVYSMQRPFAQGAIT
jgi:hypothetical protein